MFFTFCFYCVFLWDPVISIKNKIRRKKSGEPLSGSTRTFEQMLPCLNNGTWKVVKQSMQEITYDIY